ncbi:MAG TPA: hypothetical protein VFS00_34585, partial [Polyangiaceae bacterium]|nr:hypothetical protein [Polyangiaceae bacterium]
MSRGTPRGTPAPPAPPAEAEAQRAAEAERANLLRLLAQAPAAVAIVRGPDHVFVLSNALNQRLTGGRPLLGRPAREALP